MLTMKLHERVRQRERERESERERARKIKREGSTFQHIPLTLSYPHQECRPE